MADTHDELKLKKRRIARAIFIACGGRLLAEFLIRAIDWWLESGDGPS